MLSSLSWLACRLSSLDGGAAPLSQPSWSPPPNSECIPATIPGTILGALLLNGTFVRPDNSSQTIIDPYVDDWLSNNTIPDISWIGSDFYTFVFRTTLTTTDILACSSPSNDATIILSAPQLSYRASLFLDGSSIPTIDGDSQAVGMFKRHDFSFGTSSSFCNSTQRGISLLVQPPDHAGIPSAFCSLYPPNFNNTIPCGQGGNHSLAMDIISQDLQGWDFEVASPDRNTGVIDGLEVQVANSSILLRDGAIAVYNLTLSGHGGIGAPLGSGNITFRASIRNVGIVNDVTGAVTFMIDTSDSNFVDTLSTQVRVSLPVNSGWIEVISEPLSIPPGVALWWPHTVGIPTLRTANASFVSDASVNEPATTLSWRAGLRTVSCDVDLNLGGRAITINGKRIYLEGGNFVGTDLLSRPYWRSDERYSDEVKLHAAMGFNAMRLWGGHGGHPDSLFTAADEAGIFLWNEFFMSGDNNGRWAGNASWPLEHDLYNIAVSDTIRRLRGHPSLLVHVGGNELFPFNASPPLDILASITSSIAALDPSTPFVQSSMGSNEFANFSGFDAELAFAPSDGPYGILDERSFFSWPAPGKPDTFNIPWAFQPELGASAHPSRTSLDRFLSPAHANAIPGPRGLNTDTMWTWHSFESFGDNFNGDAVYALAPNGTHTSPESWDVEEYSAAAAVVQTMQLQALFEAYSDRMWSPRTGVLYWKSAGSWPALRGALYDWYLALGGGFFGAVHALETVHVQLSRRPSDEGGASIAVVNRGGVDLVGGPFKASVSAINLITGDLVGFQLTSPFLQVPTQTVLHIPDSSLVWPPLAPLSNALLWRVELSTMNESIISRSEYVMSTLSNDPKISLQNFSALALARTIKIPLTVSAVCTSSSSGGVVAQVNMSIANGVALFVRCDLHDPATRVVSETGSIDDRVLPIFTENGFFSILKSEEIPLSIYAPRAFWPSTTLAVQCEGWNVEPTRVACV
jgi:mannosylglycoprotein endo-beta-mannosidase